MISPFILRRLKTEVLSELPQKSETVLRTSMEGEQKKLYIANVALIKRQIQEDAETEFEKRKFHILAMITKLRQICCDPSLCYENYDGPSAKLDVCIELLRESVDGGHKVLLFSQFTSMLAMIEEKLIEEGISYYILKGDTPKEKRAQMAERFNYDTTRVFLISLKAGGTGLNLTGADVVIHYDPWWNVAAQNQATDRAHRIGQKKSVQVYKLVTSDSIEEKIINLQQSKKELAESIISDQEGGSIFNMTKDELMDLLS
jgi:SNF2 family DNA or RNA helicase